MLEVLMITELATQSQINPSHHPSGAPFAVMLRAPVIRQLGEGGSTSKAYQTAHGNERQRAQQASYFTRKDDGRSGGAVVGDTQITYFGVCNKRKRERE